MSLKVGIIGLPNVGKSTLFKALTKKEVEIADYPFTTISPNVGMVAMPDKRLDAIAKVIKPEKVLPAFIEFVDIAGLVEGAHRGEGLGNQFLSHIRECHALVHVIDSFRQQNQNSEIVEKELLMKDIEIIENHIEKLENKRDKDYSQEINVLLETKQQLLKNEVPDIKELQLLTLKPAIKLFNTKNHSEIIDKNKISLNIKMELELLDLSEKEQKELEIKSFIDQLILMCYNVLNLITFFTIKGNKETRSWLIDKNTKAPDAGEKVHSDFKEKFIRAEAINYNDFVKSSGWIKAKEQGLVKTIGKDYIVQDGDILEFKI